MTPLTLVALTIGGLMFFGSLLPLLHRKGASSILEVALEISTFDSSRRFRDAL